MKQFFALLLISTFLLNHQVQAQNVSYKNDTIYVDRVPYCAMKSSGSFAKNFKVYTLSGTEILRVIYDVHTTEYTATFIPDLEQCIYHFQSIKLGRDLARSIVDAQLIKADTLDKKAVEFFMKMYGTPLQANNGLSLGNLAGALSNLADGMDQSLQQLNQTLFPERDRSATVFIRGNEITQDHVSIGRCERNMKAVPGGLSYNYTFYNTNNTVVAIAKVIGGEAEISTVKNNGFYNVKVRDSNTLEVEKEIANWLIDHYYL